MLEDLGKRLTDVGLVIDDEHVAASLGGHRRPRSPGRHCDLGRRAHHWRSDPPGDGGSPTSAVIATLGGGAKPWEVGTSLIPIKLSGDDRNRQRPPTPPK